MKKSKHTKESDKRKNFVIEALKDKCFACGEMIPAKRRTYCSVDCEVIVGKIRGKQIRAKVEKLTPEEREMVVKLKNKIKEYEEKVSSDL